MKLVLSSNGFSTPEIIKKVVELVEKPQDKINIAVINEAYAVEHGDHGWVLHDLNCIKTNFKGNMELVNLLALSTDTIIERVELADVIYVVGGHTDYLMSVFNETGFGELLPELLQGKVYVGSSAGSMVVCRRVSTEAYQKIYGEGDDFSVSEYLNLTNFAIKPHLGNPLFPNNRKEILLEVAANFDGTLFGLSDDAAIIIEGDKQYVLGSEPIKIVNGNIV